MGKIAPQRTIIISAPFEGNIQALLVEHGQQVAQGQTLLTVDPATLEIQLRDALAVKLRAERINQELRDWDRNAQVVRARRSVRSATMLLSNLQQRLRDSRNLLQRGFIARNELDDPEQQLQMQALESAAAQNELQLVLDQGAGEQRRIAEMELQNATVKYEGLKTLLHGRQIVAPFTGVVVPVSITPDATSSGPLQTGARLTQGQALFGIADIEKLKIVALVSELDINQLHPGQAVEIEGDGFEGERLSGLVQIVSNFAEPSDEATASATFLVTLSVRTLTAQQLRRVRLGMTSRLSIITYRNEQAIVVPIDAIRQDGEATVVDFRETAHHPARPMNVTLGIDARWR